MRFTRHIGIDYSGAQAPESRLKGLQVYGSRNGGTPERISMPTEGAKNWTRLEVAQFCVSEIESGELHYGYHRSASAAYGVATVEIGDALSWDELVAESRVRKPQRKLALHVESIEETGRFPPTPHLVHVENGRISTRPEVAAERDRAAAGLRALIGERLATTPKTVFDPCGNRPAEGDFLSVMIKNADNLERLFSR